MREPAFTPGPWTFRRVESVDENDRPSLVYCQIGPVAEFEFGKPGSVAYAGTYGKSVKQQTSGIRQSEAECEANARLIAAAPALYEALRMCLLNGNLDEQEREHGEAALSLALGESPNA